MLREFFLITAGASVLVSACAASAPSDSSAAAVALPSPRTVGDSSLEEVLATRRSMRVFADRAVAPEMVAQLLWSAQGVTADDGGRTAPSAGALYPIEVYVVDHGGAHRYLPDEHALQPVEAARARPVG